MKSNIIIQIITNSHKICYCHFNVIFSLHNHRMAFHLFLILYAIDTLNSNHTINDQVKTFRWELNVNYNFTYTGRQWTF